MVWRYAVIALPYFSMVFMVYTGIAPPFFFLPSWHAASCGAGKVWGGAHWWCVAGAAARANCLSSAGLDHTSPWSIITVTCDTFLMIIKSTFYVVLVSLLTYFQWFSCVLLKVTLCAWLLPFNCCHFDMCLCRILWMLANLVVVGQALLVLLALHGLAGVYLKR